MRKAVLSVMMIGILAACGAAPAKRYFELSIAAIAGPAVPRVDRTLAIEPTTVARLYDNIRIPYRVSDFELKYYPYEFWAQDPGRVVDAALAGFFRAKPVFTRLAGFAPDSDQDITLRPRLHVIEEVDAAAEWQARLAMTLEFVEAKSGKVLVTHSFDRTARMAVKKVEALPEALSRILEQELAAAVVELAKALEKKAG